MLIINYYRFKQIILKGMQDSILSMPSEIDLEEIFKAIEETFLIWSQADGVEAVKEAVAKLSWLDSCWNKPELILNKVHLAIRRIELFLNGSSCRNGSLNIAAEDLGGAHWFLSNFLKVLGSCDLNREMRIRTLARFLAGLKGKGELPKTSSMADLETKTLPMLKDLVKIRDSIPKPNVLGELIKSGVLTHDEIWTFLQGRGNLEISFTELKDSLPYLLSSLQLLKVESLKNLLLIISKNKKVSLNCLNNILHLISGVYTTLPLEKKQEFLDALFKILGIEVISLEKWPDFQEKVHQLLLKSYDLHHSEAAVAEIVKAFIDKNAKAKSMWDELHKQFLEVEKYKLNLILLTNPDLRQRIEECRLKLQETNTMNDAQKCYLVALCLESSRRTLGLNPTLIQIFNLLAYLHDPKARRISSQQEGKERSMVLAWLAAFKAMNMSVDILCLNSKLASRNVYKFIDFFNFLGLKALPYSAGQNRREILEADILYGTLEDFESEYLDRLDPEEVLLFKPLRQRKAFEVVIVDEMRDLFLDSKYKKMQIKKPVSYLNPKLYQIIFDFMSKPTPQDTPKNPLELQRILYQTCKLLYPLHRVERWMKSYEIAATYSINKDYLVWDKQIVVLQETEEDPIEKHGKRFPKGIHCFLEIMHKLEPTPEFGIHAMVFHSDFINLYRECFGASTSMVTSQDREELLKVYQLSYFRSPPYFQNLKMHEPVLIAENGEEQNKLLIKDLNEKLLKGRPVVIYCENAYDCRTVYADLDEEFGFDEQTIVQTFHEFTRTEDEDLGDQSEDLETFLRAGLPKSITIATETALDLNKIPLDKDTLAAGGLHVVVIYPPNRRRFLDSFFVEQHIPGSLRYIVEKIDLESQIEDFSFRDTSGKICKLQAETIAKDKLFKEWQQILDKKMFYGNIKLYHNFQLNALHAELQKLHYHLWKLFSKNDRMRMDNEWSTIYSSSVDQFKELRQRLSRCPIARELPIVVQHEAEKYIANFLAEIWKRFQISNVTLQEIPGAALLPVDKAKTLSMTTKVPIINTLQTPLHYALEYQNESLACLLAAHRPEYITIANAKGENSIDLALKYNCTSFIKAFEKGVNIREGIETLAADLKSNSSPKAYKPLLTIYEYVFGKIPSSKPKTTVKNKYKG